MSRLNEIENRAHRALIIEAPGGEFDKAKRWYAEGYDRLRLIPATYGEGMLEVMAELTADPPRLLFLYNQMVPPEKFTHENIGRMIGYMNEFYDLGRNLRA